MIPETTAFIIIFVALILVVTFVFVMSISILNIYDDTCKARKWGKYAEKSKKQIDLSTLEVKELMSLNLKATRDRDLDLYFKTIEELQVRKNESDIDAYESAMENPEY